MSEIITSELIDKLGVKRVCRECKPKELALGKAGLKGHMCPQCGNHFDEFGNHNKFRAYKWIYETFKQAGFPLNDLHIESLYLMARAKVSSAEATYLETLHEALDALRKGGKLPE